VRNLKLLLISTVSNLLEGNARLQGIETSLNMTGNEYNIALVRDSTNLMLKKVIQLNSISQTMYFIASRRSVLSHNDPCN